MCFSSNVKQFVLLIIVGIFLLLGYVVFNHFNERQNMVWFDTSKIHIPVDEDQRNTRYVVFNHFNERQNMVWFDTSKIHIPVDEDQRNTRLLYKQPSVLVGRTDVVAVTPWLAPIVWEGTFDPDLVDIIYKSMNLTIATTVFAVGKLLVVAQGGWWWPNSLLSTLYRWQEISARRMEIIQTAIEHQISREADYIFCLDVDSKFHARWGAESLGRLVAVIHPWFYQATRDLFTYERRPASTAYIPMDEGDYYYAGAVFGGSVEDVYTLTKVFRNQLEEDARNSIEAAWQEESHLNRYLLYNKPSKLLSPEYQWDDKKTKTNEVKVIRFSSVIKNYAEIRAKY
ncbi:globoside alpha-1,3-N-acetylgalactosaminyltransferase 1-like [Salmo salar]|uniref:Globoside alpha-1,3-N-acetylgalactosaminyltransferase 1-like n=1 Tax=Salmo salar TaxID=8030 RepID=A0ABM3F5A2_SALSA|nr:globoside alpha-1,3-N-acetylgalactosaminyltransferase 1-like [Salmo salar]